MRLDKYLEAKGGSGWYEGSEFECKGWCTCTSWCTMIGLLFCIPASIKTHTNTGHKNRTKAQPFPMRELELEIWLGMKICWNPISHILGPRIQIRTCDRRFLDDELQMAASPLVSQVPQLTRGSGNLAATPLVAFASLQCFTIGLPYLPIFYNNKQIMFILASFTFLGPGRDL